MPFEIRVVDVAAQPERVMYSQSFEDPAILRRVILALNRAPRRRKRKADEPPR